MIPIRPVFACIIVFASPLFVACTSEASVGGDTDAASSTDANDLETTSEASSEVSADTSTDTGASDTSADPSGGAIDAACAKLAAARCARMKACEPYTLGVQYASDASCLARQTLWCTTIAAAPKTGVTATGIEACAVATPKASCLEWRNEILQPECRFIGGLKDDEACIHDGQCASGACDRSGPGLCGKCLPRSAFDGACSIGTPVSVCEQGSKCETTPTGMKCVKLSGPGESCDPYGPQECLKSLSCVSGKCIAQLTTEGTTCTPPFSVGDSPDCDLGQGYLCNAGKCAKAKLLLDGESCSFDGEACGAPEYCAISSSTCKPRKDDGAACSVPVECAFPAVCSATVSGTCTVPTGTTCPAK